MLWNCTWLGIRVGLFTPDRAFENVVKTKITQLKQPCLKLVELCVEEIRQILIPLTLKVGIRVCKWMTLLLTICLFFVPHSAGGRFKNLGVHMVQVNLCQKHLFSHQLTHNMTRDCSLIYQFSTWKLQAQNMLYTIT